MVYRSRILHHADIQAGEEKTFGILFLQCFATGFASAFFFIATSVNFINKVSISHLPLGYILSGVTGFMLMRVYKNSVTRSGFMPAYRSGLIAYAFLCVLLYIASILWKGNGSVETCLAYLGFVMIMPFFSMFSLGFSALCLSIYNLSQSKRLLALVSTGDTVAAVIAYLFVPLFLKRVSPDPVHLLPVAAVLVTLSLVPLTWLRKQYSVQFRHNPAQAYTAGKGALFFVKDPFYLIIAVVTFFSVQALYLADYTYLISVRYLATQTEWKLTAIVSGLFCIIKAGELFFSLLSKNILAVKGMKFSLLLLPAILVFSTMMGIFTNTIFSEFSFFLIIFLLLTKWSERVIRKGITIPAMRVLYQSIRHDERLKVQGFMEGALSQVSTVLSGLLLLIISSYYAEADTRVFLNVLAITGGMCYALWMLVTFRLFKNYKLQIQRYLKFAEHQKPAAVQAPGLSPDITIASFCVTDSLQHASFNWKKLIQDELGYLMMKTDDCLSNIAVYNVSLTQLLRDGDEDWIFKNLVRTYFGNRNFFSRILIIWYMHRMSSAFGLRFMKEVFDVSDITQKLEIVSILNRANYKSDQEDVYYFMNLCHNCTTEIIWIKAVMEDIKMLERIDLNNALIYLTHRLKKLLLKLLKVLHDPEVIRQVEEVLMQEGSSTEKQLFALELLDAILHEGLKEVVLLAFEEVPFSANKQKFRNILPVCSASAAQRLKDLVMRDYKIIDPYTRETALVCYFELTGDEDILKAFTESELENMSVMSHKLLSKNYPEALHLRAEAVKAISPLISEQPMYLSYFMRDGIKWEKRRSWGNEIPATRYDAFKHTAYVYADDHQLCIDTLGLAVLYRLDMILNKGYEYGDVILPDFENR